MLYNMFFGVCLFRTFVVEFKITDRMKTRFKEGFIVGNIFFEKDDITFACTEEYLQKLKAKGVIDLPEYLEKLEKRISNLETLNGLIGG